MNPDIRKLGGLNLYFPYLDSKQGEVFSIRSQLEWIVLSSLFVDRIIFPPRSIFSGRFALQNLADLHGIPLLRGLVECGILITTVTSSNIRDLPDLFERYSGLVSSPSQRCGADFLLFSRDESFQRRVVTDYMFEKIQAASYLKLHEKVAIAKLLATQPNHSQLIGSIHDLFPLPASDALHHLTQEAMVGYFLGGAKGNAAIMPPPQANEAEHSSFDFFYSKNALSAFGNQLTKKLSKPIHQLSIHEVQKLKANLNVFRQKYNDLSIKHRELFSQVLASVSKSHPALRLRAPIITLQATVATAIGVALAPVFGAAAFGLTVAAKWLWESISKGYKINDRVSDQVRLFLTRNHLLTPYHKDLLDLLDIFETSVNSAMKR